MAAGSRPGISVVIPVYNREGMVGSAVESVLEQEEAPAEILVVDDGSTDGTAGVLGRYGDRIRVLRQGNRGPGAARNLGARESGGTYVAFLDSDDRWYPWTLATYRGVLERHPGVAVVAGRLHPFPGEDPPRPAPGEEPGVLGFRDYLASCDEWRWRGASSFVIRRDAFLRVGGFLEEPVNAEDADLMLRLGTEPGFVQVVRPATFGYRVHGESLFGNLDRTAAGCRHLVGTELGDGYPGGRDRRSEREVAIGRHVRPVSLELLRRGSTRDAWWLYRKTLPWHVRQFRLRYLAGFPAVAAAGLFGRRGGR